jgi:hypothetical protein
MRDARHDVRPIVVLSGAMVHAITARRSTAAFQTTSHAFKVALMLERNARDVVVISASEERWWWIRMVPASSIAPASNENSGKLSSKPFSSGITGSASRRPAVTTRS